MVPLEHISNSESFIISNTHKVLTLVHVYMHVHLLQTVYTMYMQNCTVEDSNSTYWVAIATIIVSPSVDNERFQCFVSIGEQITSHQVLLRVEPESKAMMHAPVISS